MINNKYINIILLSFSLLTTLHAQKTVVPNIPAPQGMAVNTYTGNLFFQRNEQSLRGTDFRIYQSFYYNAAVDTLNYGYGHGWSFYYNIHYREVADSIIIYHADANKDVFLFRNGLYKSAMGIFDVLTKTGNQLILKSKDGTRHIFADPSHKKITRIEDKNNNYVNIEYTGANPTRILNSSGRSLLLTWQNGLLKEAKDESDVAKKHTYLYNNAKDLVTVVDALGGRKNFSYKNHRLTHVSDQNNNPIVISYYDNGGKVRQITSCNSEQRFSYLTNPHKTFVTQKSDAGNVVNGYIFDDNQRLTAFTDPEGNRTDLKYDENSNLLELTDSKGVYTHFEYDIFGNLIKETDPIGNISQFSFEYIYNNPTTYKNKKGALTSLTYDNKGNLISITKPNNATETYTYDAWGKVLSHKDAKNNTTNYQYNTNGDLISIQYPTGTVQLEYNGSCCNVGKITDPNGNTTEMTYDLLNRVKTVKDKAGNTIAYDYDAVGNLIKETDPVGNIKEFSYDALNRLISVKLPVGTWHYSYDGQGNLTKMTDANGHSTTYEYDKKQRLKKEIDPLGNTTANNYDLNGNLIQRLDPNNNVVHYKYDLLNRLIEKSFTGNTDKFAYDEEGNMVSAFNNDIAYTFEYDDLNRLLKKNILTWNKSLSYTYDVAGNRKTMTDHDGGLTTYNYDNNNRLINLTNPSNITTSFEYDAGGRPKKQINGNGTFTTYHYDLAGRMDSLINWKNNTEKISFFYYTFDQFGNRKTLTDKRGLNTYNYDGSYRLISVTYPDGSTESFSFDGSGNRTIRTKNGATTNYTYNAADQIQTAGNKGFAFDANGNTIQQTGSQPKNYKYDAENRLVEVILPSQRKVQFKYDPFGDKIEKIDTLSEITKMLYNENNLLAELNFSNITQNSYTTTFGTDTWISKSNGSKNYFFHKDGLNSTTEFSNFDKTIENEYQYNVFGDLLYENVNIDNDILFTGRLIENNTKIYDYRSRFYDSQVGRFINRDLYRGDIENPLSLNNFIYVENSTVNFIDPNGYSPVVPIIIGAAIVGAAIYANSPMHTQRNCRNEIPSGVPDQYGNLNGWVKFSNYQSLFHQPNTPLLDIIKGLKSGVLRYKKYGKVNPDGSSSEAIWDSVVNRFLNTGEKGGPSFNYSNPTGFSGNLGHIKLDMIPHIFKDKYEECQPPTSPGSKDPMPNSPNGDPIKIPIIAPVDPNEVIGPLGIDSLKWVSVKQTLPYKILFENDPEFATAPAQNVTVYLPIHPKFNPASLRISDFGFGSFNFTVPQNTSIYTSRLDLRDSLGLYVDITAGLDIANRRAFWIFQSIDPATGLTSTLPANSGFLPVNDTLIHNGEGYVTFTIIPSSLAQTRDSVTAQAQIIFDTEESIKTNTWVNIIDAVAPISKVDTLYAIGGNTVRLKFSGKDDSNGVGVDFYDLYVSQDEGEFLLNQSKIKGITFDFKGNPNSIYKFYTIATDSVGNREASKFSSNKSIFLGISPPTLVSSKDTACTGEIILLTASNCSGLVTWSTGQTSSSVTVNITENAGFTANCTVNQITSNESDSLKVAWRGNPPTATLSGTQTIIAGQSAELVVNLTGASPYAVLINNQKYANIVNSPKTISVSPSSTTVYTLDSAYNACGGVKVLTNNTATVSVTPQTLTTAAISGSPFCAGTNLNISFTATGTFGSGNVFTAQLSDSTGSFVSPINIGTLTSMATSATISSTIPLNTLHGTQYRIRVISSNSSINGSDNGSNIIINAKATASLTGTQTIMLGEQAPLKVTMTGTPPFIVAINGDAYSNINSPFILPVSPTQTTTYTLLTVTDVCGTVNINSNNIATVTVSTTCLKPDLIISDLTITKYTPTRINYTAQIKNIGLTNASMSSFFLGVYTSSDELVNANDVWKYSITTGGGTLAPNQTLNFSYNTSFNFTDNQYHLRLKADELGLISECDEANNNLFKLVNKCTTTGNLNLTGNISSGYYATNQVVTISNAAISDNVLVVGKSISGTLALTALNSVFMIGGCLNAPASNVATAPAIVNKPKPIINFLETDSKQIVEFSLTDELTTTIYIWNSTTNTKVGIIQEKAKNNKGLNTIDLTPYNLNGTDIFILNIETPDEIYAKVID
jgi:RHS repeat-associated protein